MKKFKYQIISLLISGIFLSEIVNANLLIPLEQIPPKTVFTLRQDINFVEKRNFALVNDYAAHENFPEVNTFYQSGNTEEDLISFFRYQNMLSPKLTQSYQQCLESIKSKWSKSLQANPDNISFIESNIDTDTLIVFDTSTGSSVITNNTCDYPKFYYAALILKKSAEGSDYHLASGEKLIVRGVRVKQLESVYRISITFNRHKFVKSLDIITAENPINILLRQLNFSTKDAIIGKTFGVQPPKERYF